MTEIGIVARSVEKTHVWLNDVASELGTEDRQVAYRVLRAYLHALRDRLSIDEAAQLAALDGEARAAYGVSAAATVLRRPWRRRVTRSFGLSSSPMGIPSAAASSSGS